MNFLKTACTVILLFLIVVTSLAAQNKNSVRGDLEALRDLFATTNGDSWRNNSGWLKGDPSNNWYGVRVDGNGRVIRLDLYRNNLRGELPKSIGNLRKLQFFSVKGNPINSEIPKSIANWVNAEILLFSSDQTKSPHNMPNERTYNNHPGKTYNVSTAKYRGTIPDVFDKMPKLRIFQIAWQEKLDRQPYPSTLYNHPSLEILELQGTQLTGMLSNKFKLPEMRRFFIGNNHLEGRLPNSLGTMRKVVNIKAGHSNWFVKNTPNVKRFEGALPASFSNFNRLKYFFVSNHTLEGEIPDYVIKNWSSLREIGLNNNNFSGEIPKEFGDFNITVFMLGDNNFSGAIHPNLVSGMQRVIVFSIQGNNLSGVVPNGEMVNGEWKGWRTKSRLRTVWMQDNEFTGPLPDMPEYVGDMSVLALHRNNFTGGIPDSWKELFTPSLRNENPRRTFNNLQLRGNQLQGVIPAWFTGKNYDGSAPDVKGNRWSHRDILENSVNVSAGEQHDASQLPFGEPMVFERALGGNLTYDYSNKIHSADKIVWSKLNDSTDEWEQDERFNDMSLLELTNIENSDFGAYRMELYNSNSPLPDWVVSKPIIIKEGEDNNDSSGTTYDAQNFFPNAPILLGPVHQSVYTGLTPKFEWSTVEGSDYYIIHVSSLSPAGGLVQDVIKDETTEATYTPKVLLEPHALYYWQVKPIKGGEEGEWSDQWEFSLLEPMAQKSVKIQSDEQQPVSTSLKQNYPNPFNPTTRIEFALSNAQKVSLKVYDMAGRQVALLVDDVLQAGQHSATLDASHFASGIYIYRFVSNTHQFSRKMTLIK